MNKQVRQYIGLFTAMLVYYVIHEGAHFIYALLIGTFKQIHFMGFGMQVDVFANKMSEIQIGVFCLAGSIATLLFAYLFVLLMEYIEKSKSNVFKASMYYITIALLFLDPLYLSLLCGLFGGGDMNGISLLMQEWLVRIMYGGVLLVNLIIFLKFVLPKYTRMFNSK